MELPKHFFTHALVSLVVSSAIMLLGFKLGFLVGPVFYSLRELYDYFVLKKRHEGRFDWEGLLGGLVGLISIVLI